MAIAVIGCGSLGGVIAARLLRTEEHRVFIIDFDRKIQNTVTENGLVIRTRNKITIQNGLVGLDLAHADGIGMERVIQSAVLWGATTHQKPLCYEITAPGTFVIGSLS